MKVKVIITVNFVQVLTTDSKDVDHIIVFQTICKSVVSRLNVDLLI